MDIYRSLPFLTCDRIEHITNSEFHFNIGVLGEVCKVL